MLRSAGHHSLLSRHCGSSKSLFSASKSCSRESKREDLKIMPPKAEGDTIETQKQKYNFRIVKEELKYSRYIQVFNRVVEHPPQSSQPPLSPADRIIEYDVVGARTESCHFVAVIPYHSSSKTVTLISEYAQGANELVYGVPCGGLSNKHTSLEDCATKELSEEAFLKGGRLIRLLPESHPGLLEVKWCKNRFTPFLVIDPEHDTNPHPRDLEEFINLQKVDIPTLKKIMFGGDMMLPSIVSCGMALEYLESHNYL